MEGGLAVGVAEGAVVLLLLAVMMGKLFEGVAELAAEVFGLLLLPVVEGEAVAEGEAGEEVAVVEGNGRFELGRGAGVRGSRGEKLLELEGVAPDGVGFEPDGVAVAADDAVADCFFEGGEGAAEGGFSVAVVVFGPEEGGEVVAERPLVGERQVGEEGDGFAGIGFNGLPVAFDAGRAEKVEREFRHGADFSSFFVFRNGFRNVWGTVGG